MRCLWRMSRSFSPFSHARIPILKALNMMTTITATIVSAITNSNRVKPLLTVQHVLLPYGPAGFDHRDIF